MLQNGINFGADEMERHTISIWGGPNMAWVTHGIAVPELYEDEDVYFAGNCPNEFGYCTELFQCPILS